MIGRKKNFYIHACNVKILHQKFFSRDREFPPQGEI